MVLTDSYIFLVYVGGISIENPLGFLKQILGFSLLYLPISIIGWLLSGTTPTSTLAIKQNIATKSYRQRPHANKIKAINKMLLINI